MKICGRGGSRVTVIIGKSGWVGRWWLSGTIFRVGHCFFFATEEHGRTRKNGTVDGVALRAERHDWGFGNREPSARQEPRPPEGE